MKKILLLSFFISHLSFASDITCPTVTALKQHNFHGWIPLTVTSSSEPDEDNIEAFLSNIDSFYLAEWRPESHYSANCYYHSNSELFEDLYFANHVSDIHQQGNWHWHHHHEIAYCESESPELCGFSIKE